jgi:PAS domain S-box-containing protein
VNQSLAGIAESDPDGRFINVNDRFCEITGYPREELLEHRKQEIIHPDDQPRSKELIRRCVEHHEPFVIEKRYVRKDGSAVWVHNSVSPVYDAEGELQSIVTVCIDINKRKRDEMALRESEERYRALAEQISDGIFIADGKGRYVNANSTAATMLGYSREELLSLTIPDVLHPDELVRLPQQFERLAGGGIVQNDWRLVRKDGSVFIGELTGRQLPNAQMLSVVRDVTERRRVEQALRLSEERFQFISERAQIGYWDWDIVANRLEWSPLCKNLFGIAQEEEVTYERFLTALHPDDRARTDRAVRDCLESGGAREYDIEYRTSRPDGSVHWIHARGAAVFIEGNAVRMAGIVLDVSERRRTEEALRETTARLRESEAQFRTLAETVPLLVWSCAPTGECDYLSRQWTEYAGVPESRLLGYQWLDFVHPEDRERVTARWRESIAGGPAFDVELRILGNDGVCRWFKTRARPHLDTSGRVMRWFGTNTDISELKQIEEQLRRANGDLEQFAYSASHDLQEPLRSIKIYSQLLEMRVQAKLDVEELEFLSYLRTGAMRMELLLRDLLAYTQTVRLEEPGEPYEAAEAMKSALDGLAAAIAQSGAKIHVGTLPAVRIHRTHLQLLFQNLVGNAIKYRRSGVAPEIHVSAKRQNDNWLFAISDNGIGIDAEYQEGIFGLFKRLHTSDEYSGTGIGLAICQRMVERYQGRIWVESEPGRGSTFYFTLPV